MFGEKKQRKEYRQITETNVSQGGVQAGAILGWLCLLDGFWDYWDGFKTSK